MTRWSVEEVQGWEVRLPLWSSASAPALITTPRAMAAWCDGEALREVVSADAAPAPGAGSRKARARRGGWVHHLDGGAACAARSDAAEAEFEAAVAGAGWVAVPTRNEADTRSHVDYLLMTPADARAVADGSAEATAVRAVRVDLKALKSLQRDGPLDNERLWLEMHGAKSTATGWLRGGLAEVIAVQVGGGAVGTRPAFAMLHRARLAAWAMDKVDWAAPAADTVAEAVALPWRLYRRRDRERLAVADTREAFAAAGCGVLVLGAAEGEPSK